MIRFIEIGNQIDCDDERPSRQFAFFNTINNKFLEFDGEQVWDSWESFTCAWVEHWRPDGERQERMRYDPATTGLEDQYVNREYERLKGLCRHYVDVETAFQRDRR